MSPPWSPIGRHDAEHDVVDAVGVEARVALPQLVDQADHEVDRLHLVQRARGLALATRGAEVVVHECFCHVPDCDSISVTVNRDHGVPGESTVRIDLGPGRTAVAVTAGNSHACAILDTGAAALLGLQRLRAAGPGQHQPASATTPARPRCTSTSASARTAVAVDAGDYHTCAILDTGQLRCWGHNASGQLGQGNINDIGDNPGETTVPVDLGVGTNGGRGQRRRQQHLRDPRHAASCAAGATTPSGSCCRATPTTSATAPPRPPCRSTSAARPCHGGQRRRRATCAPSLATGSCAAGAPARHGQLGLGQTDVGRRRPR